MPSRSRTSSDSSTGDDLSAPCPRQTSLFIQREADGSDDETETGSGPRKEDDASSEDHGERVAFSEGDDDPGYVYKNFKERTNRKTQISERRKAAATSRKSKGSDSVVGMKAAAPVRRKRKREREEFRKDDTDSGSDTAIENALPDYIKDRRADFEASYARLGTNGLRLPPLYDDIDFDELGPVRDLPTRPHFPLAKPLAPNRDVELQYSAGIVPAPIAKRLRSYQVQGAEFLHELFVFQRGGLLGDDMGLGKTIQVIAFLTAAFGKTADARDARRMRKSRMMNDDRWYPKVLIVCPGSLMENWKNELDKWGWWNVGQYHDTGKEAVVQAACHGRHEIVITTYTTLTNNLEQLNKVDWDCCIADECHILKNRKSKTTMAMDRINALCRIGLTGTALQNRYEELWVLLNWCSPGKFGPISVWKNSISLPLKIGQSHDASNDQLAAAREIAQKLVHNLLPRFFLRRMKTLIADQLPKKTDKVIFCPLTQSQGDAYQRLVDSGWVEPIRRATEMCHCGSNRKRGWCCEKEMPNGDDWHKWVFPMLNTLQKLCNHLAMLIPSSSEDKERQDKELYLLEAAMPDDWQELFKTRDNILNFANVEFCGKWKVLKQLLEFWFSQNSDGRTPNKILVFSHSVRLLRMLHVLFTSTTSYNVSYLDGSMAYIERQKAVDEFNASEDQFVFLISTKAGGVGLNITSANKVVVFDPNWNPAYDLQAQDRAYRIGQVRDVDVFRLVSAGTVEEIVYARQIYKQQQANIAYTASNERRYFHGVQDTSDKRGEIFGLTNIFSYESAGVRLRDIVNKTNIAESRAEFHVAELVVNDDDDEPADDDERQKTWDPKKENEAMSQMAADLTGESTSRSNKKKVQLDSVNSILAKLGVEYTHENSEVIGSSKAEAVLSKKAQEATGQGKGQEQVFAADKSRAVPDAMDVDEPISYTFNPPKEVRSRQFVTMAKMEGYDDAVEFALLVEGWTQKQRRDCLERFYKERRRLLADA